MNIHFRYMHARVKVYVLLKNNYLHHWQKYYNDNEKNDSITAATDDKIQI